MSFKLLKLLRKRWCTRMVAYGRGAVVVGHTASPAAGTRAGRRVSLCHGLDEGRQDGSRAYGWVAWARP